MVIRIDCLISNEGYVYVCYITQSLIDCFILQYDVSLYNFNDFNLFYSLKNDMESSFCFVLQIVHYWCNKHCRFYQIAWATWGDKILIHFILNRLTKQPVCALLILLITMDRQLYHKKPIHEIYTELSERRAKPASQSPPREARINGNMFNIIHLVYV